MQVSSLAISVGRCRTSNDVSVNSPSVSRRHLNLVVHSLEHIDLEDCGSSYGSWYWNGAQWQSFEQIRLGSNDHIVIGDAKLRVMEIIIAFQVRARSRTQ